MCNLKIQAMDRAGEIGDPLIRVDADGTHLPGMSIAPTGAITLRFKTAAERDAAYPQLTGKAAHDFRTDVEIEWEKKVENKDKGAAVRGEAVAKSATDQLYGAVMNIKCDVSQCILGGDAARMAYKMGHHDARHAAADLIAAFSSSPRAADAPSEPSEPWSTGFEQGKSVGLHMAASMARALYVQHVHHHGVDGLLKRCEEMADKLVTAAAALDSQPILMAYVATDLDGHADVGLTIEAAKHRAGPGCDTIIALHDISAQFVELEGKPVCSPADVCATPPTVAAQQGSIDKDSLAGIIALADRIEEADGKPISIDRSAARVIDKLTDFYYSSSAPVAPIAPDGWKLVPIKPTERMTEAGRDARLAGATHMDSLCQWRAMLAAAPTPQQEGSEAGNG